MRVRRFGTPPPALYSYLISAGLGIMLQVRSRVGKEMGTTEVLVPLWALWYGSPLRKNLGLLCGVDCLRSI